MALIGLCRYLAYQTRLEGRQSKSESPGHFVNLKTIWETAWEDVGDAHV